MTKFQISSVLGAVLLAASLTPSVASAQLTTTLMDLKGAAQSLATQAVPCTGPVKFVDDITFEGVKTTSWTYPNGWPAGTGFDPVPALSKQINLTKGCLNAHLSVMVGSARTYAGFSPITLFQVRVTPAATGVPVILDGHYPTCYGITACVAESAEYDVDMLAANFYKPVNTAQGLPPGPARVDVLWTGGPAFLGGAGAIGAAFVLKLYHY